jgi:hypothetical protein
MVKIVRGAAIALSIDRIERAITQGGRQAPRMLAIDRNGAFQREKGRPSLETNGRAMAVRARSDLDSREETAANPEQRQCGND